VSGDLAVFDPALEARSFDDPLIRFATAMCRLAMEIELGVAEGRYAEERAQRYAGALLMPAVEFAALAALPDAYLAAAFGVPAEQIAPRRVELGLGRRQC
jgi:hypothetical protein